MGKLCAKGKAAAKRKFDVYPSAYANMYASAVCSGKIKPGGKKKIQKKSVGGSISQERKRNRIRTPNDVSRGCGMVMANRRKRFTVS
jgi:hypothetical protein